MSQATYPFTLLAFSAASMLALFPPAVWQAASTALSNSTTLWAEGQDVHVS